MDSSFLTARFGRQRSIALIIHPEKSEGFEADFPFSTKSTIQKSPVVASIWKTKVGVLFSLVYKEINGTRSDNLYCVCQGHLFYQKATNGRVSLVTR